jgi:hypothetical protein
MSLRTVKNLIMKKIVPIFIAVMLLLIFLFFGEQLSSLSNRMEVVESALLKTPKKTPLRATVTQKAPAKQYADEEGGPFKNEPLQQTQSRLDKIITAANSGNVLGTDGTKVENLKTMLKELNDNKFQAAGLNYSNIKNNDLTALRTRLKNVIKFKKNSYTYRNSGNRNPFEVPDALCGNLNLMTKPLSTAQHKSFQKDIYDAVKKSACYVGGMSEDDIKTCVCGQ